MLQNIYPKSWFPEKYEGVQLFLTFILVKKNIDHQISIFKFLNDDETLKTGAMMQKIQL